VSRDDLNPPNSEHSLKNQLKGKGRRRREEQARLAAPGAAPRTLRNDVLPLLDINYLPLDQLRSPARKVRKIDPAHVREVAAAISALGFCNPILIGKDNVVLDGEVRREAAKILGLDRIPCIRVEHLTEVEQRLLGLAANRLSEKGQWDLDELKIEFEELILLGAPIEISGFSLDETDQILTGDEAEAFEQGPLAPVSGAVPVARLGDIFQLGPHLVMCGDATDPIVVRRLMEGDGAARLVLTDEPYNVKIAGHVTGGAHREFAMASGEMTNEEFLAFNVAWMEAVLPHLCEGGICGIFIDWGGWPTVFAAAAKHGLTPLNLIVWTKTNVRKLHILVFDFSAEGPRG
jgi:hypothetical protein